MKEGVLRQRRFLGIMGMILPVLVTVSRWITTGALFTLESISACHYYPDYLLFEGIMVAVGIFLLYYKGYDIKDYWLSTCAGICALLTAFAPCFYIYDPAPALLGRNFLNLSLFITGWIHNIAALGFFVFLIIIILWQFTKTSCSLLYYTKEKQKRNLVYRICGITMAVVILIGGAIGHLGIWPPALFIGEALGLELFGIAWLVKGEVLFKDKK